MKVHPKYHSSLSYVEPEIYGLAKYNLHYHELASISNMMSYNFSLGEAIFVKDFCGEALSSLNNYITKVSENDVFSFYPFNKTTNLTRLQLPNSIYNRAYININSNNIRFADQGGMITSDTLRDTLLKNFDIVFSNRSSFREYKFFIDNNLIINYIKIIGHQSSEIQVYKEDNSGNMIGSILIDESLNDDVYYNPSLKEILLENEKLVFKYKGNLSSSIAVKMQYFIVI